MTKRVGKFEIQAKLGEGGMGVVYKAYDPLMQRVVAVKTLSSDLGTDPKLRERFLKEAVAVGRFSHPNIVTVHELFEDDGKTYMVMEYLEGKTLEELSRDRSLRSLEAKLDVLLQVCDGLAHAHSLGVVHRDIKPANILVLRSGKAIILDFGLARTTASNHSMTNSRMGTPYYMSPEQWEGDTIDHRTDIFSLGVVMYQTFAGQRPFDGQNHAVVAYRVVSKEPVPLQDRVSDLPSGLCDIVAACLDKNLSTRVERVEEVQRALQSVRDGIASKREDHQSEFDATRLRFRQFVSEHRDLLRLELLEGFVDLSSQDTADQAWMSLLPFAGSNPSDESAVSSEPQRLHAPEGYLELRRARERMQDQQTRLEELAPILERAQQKLNSAKADADEAPISAFQKCEELLIEHPRLTLAREMARELLAGSRRARPEHRDQPSLSPRKLLSAARKAYHRKAWSDCRERLEAFLSIEPDDADALELLTRLERIEREERNLRTRVDNLLSIARTAVSEKRVTTCQDKLDEIERIAPSLPEVRSLRRQLDELKDVLGAEQTSRDEAVEAIALAKRAVRQGQLLDARHEVDRALRADPEVAGVTELLDDISFHETRAVSRATAAAATESDESLVSSPESGALVEAQTTFVGERSDQAPSRGKEKERGARANSETELSRVVGGGAGAAFHASSQTAESTSFEASKRSLWSRLRQARPGWTLLAAGSALVLTAWIIRPTAESANPTDSSPSSEQLLTASSVTTNLQEPPEDTDGLAATRPAPQETAGPQNVAGESKLASKEISDTRPPDGPAKKSAPQRREPSRSSGASKGVLQGPSPASPPPDVGRTASETTPREVASSNTPAQIERSRESIGDETGETNKEPEPAVVPSIEKSEEPEDEAEPVAEPPAPLVATLDLSASSEASLFINERRRGSAPASLELEPGRYTVRLESAQGANWQQTVELSQGETLRLAPNLAGKGSLSIQTKPWAFVAVNGGEPRQTPAFFEDLPIGTQRVVVSRPGYRQQSFEIVIEAGKRAARQISLEKTETQSK